MQQLVWWLHQCLTVLTVVSDVAQGCVGGGGRGVEAQCSCPNRPPSENSQQAMSCCVDHHCQVAMI